MIFSLAAGGSAFSNASKRALTASWPFLRIAIACFSATVEHLVSSITLDFEVLKDRQVWVGLCPSLTPPVAIWFPHATRGTFDESIRREQIMPSRQVIQPRKGDKRHARRAKQVPV